MPGDTTRYSFPYQEDTDAPDGPALGQDLAEQVEMIVGGIEDAQADFLRAPTRQTFTASGTWTKPAGATLVHVEVAGGGGAGGGCNATAAGQWAFGDGGGAGEYASGFFAASGLAATVAVTIGAGGTGDNDVGTNGGTTSFGAHITALGGGAGAVRPAASGGNFSTATGSRDGGSGGTGGTVRIPGGPGGSGIAIGSVVAQQRGGDGGQGRLSGGAVGGSNGAGTAGSAYGGGGSGASRAASSAAVNGGNGAAGVCIVTVWYAGPA